jgi:hypothetical protein
MKWPFGGGTAVVELEQELEVEAVDEDGKPHMIMLAADASGLASFKLYTFSDSDGAVEFIQRSFGGRSDTGLIAFWAMTEEPAIQDAGVTIEAMVLIRDDIRPEVVYPFSFLDIATAQSFVQYEMKRGLDPNNVLMYWAVPVQLGVNGEGEMGLFPANPPTRNSGGETFAPSTPIVTDEPPAAVVQAGELLESLSVKVVFDGPLVSSEDDPIEGIFQSTADDVSEEIAVEAVAEEAIAEQDETVEFAGGGDETHTEAQIFETEVSDEPAEIVVEGDEVTGTGMDEVELASAEFAAENSNEVSDEAFVTEDDVTEVAEFEPAAVASRDDEPVVVATGLKHGDELQRVLQMRRLESHSEPFEGFQSPPGRF